MKKIITLFSIIAVVLICGCSNKSNSIITTQNLTKEDEFNLLKHKVNVNYEKVSLNKKKLEESGVKSYGIYIDQYENGKKIDSGFLGKPLNINDEERSKEINVFNNISDCNDKTCNIEICVREDFIGNGSSKGFPSTQESYSSSCGQKEMKKIFFGDGSIQGLPIDDLKIESVKLNEKILIGGEAYSFEESKQSEVMSENPSIAEIAKKSDASFIVYIVFSDKEN